MDADDFELRLVLYLQYGKGATVEQVSEALDMTVDDCHELRRKALRCL